MPKPIEAMPSVIMKGETPKTATPMPLAMPMSVPAPTPASMPNGDRQHDGIGIGRSTAPPWPARRPPR